MTTVVLLHAFPLDRRMWEPVAYRLEMAGFDVVNLDLPGLGSGPELIGPPQLDFAADCVLDQLPEHAILAGVSLGGYVTMEVLRRRAEHGRNVDLEAIILCDTKSTADSDQARQARLAMADLVNSDPQACPALLRARLLDGLLRTNPDPHVRALVGEWLDDAPPTAVAWYQRAMSARPDSTRDLARFEGPGLVLWGTDDRLSPPSEHHHMLSALQQGSAAAIEGAGHLACLEQPQAVSDAIVGWLSTLQ